MTTKSLGILAGTAVAFGANSGLLAESVNADEVRAIVAEMMADPCATDVTSPDALTVARFWSDEVQVNVLPVSAFPFASNALAASWRPPRRG